MDPQQAPLPINPSKARFPLCITWTHLPMLTLLFPSIGHTGICPTSGEIHDFSGPYTVSVDDFAFGRCHKYRQQASLESPSSEEP